MIQSNQLVYAAPQFEVLSESGREQIYSAALEILERTGIRVSHDEGLSILKDAGARVDEATGVAHIPSYLVERALATTPRKALIYDRNGEPAMRLESSHFYYGTGSECVNILDSYTGETRKFTRADVSKAGLLVDSLPNIDFLMSMGIIWDEPVNVADLYQFQEMLFNTTKPIVFTCYDRRGNEDILKMASIAAGGEDEFRAKPFIIHYIEPSSPLDASKEAVDKLIFSAQNGIPSIYTPCTCAGSTSPATLAGSVAQALAESFSGIVMAQHVQPGAPIIIGGVISAMDMKTTAYLYGGPDFQLMTTATMEMARYLDLPAYGTAGCTDSKVVDEQAAIEAMFSIALQALAGGNLIHDVGYIGSGLIGSYDQLVMSDEIIGMTRRFMRGIDFDEEHLAVDVIHKVGPRGNFLSEPHTMNHFKTEHWYPSLLDRQNYDKWSADGSKDMGQRVNEKVRHLLETHEPEPLDEAKRTEINELLESEAESREVKY